MISIKKYYPFLGIWAVNAVILYLASSYYPDAFVLGNAKFSAIPAAIVAAFVWTLLTWVVKPLLKQTGIKVESEAKKYVFYYLINFVALWLTARMAPIAGFGVVSFVFVLGLALVAEAVQVVVWKLLSLLKA